jgi:hypothetical protein
MELPFAKTLLDVNGLVAVVRELRTRTMDSGTTTAGDDKSITIRAKMMIIRLQVSVVVT